MSVARVHYVKAARQRYAKEATGERTAVISKRSGEQKTTRSGRPISRRVSTVNHDKPLPPYNCGHCGKPIEVGTPYIWWEKGFRGYGGTYRRHAGCPHPKPSELESSLMADIMAAQEDAVANVDSIEAEDADTFQQEAEGLLEDVRSAIEDVAQQYRDADEAMGGSGYTESAEKADELEGIDLDFSLSLSDPEGCGDAWKGEDDDEADDHDEPEEGCAECDSRKAEWLDEARNELTSFIEEIELP